MESKLPQQPQKSDPASDAQASAMAAEQQKAKDAELKKLPKTKGEHIYDWLVNFGAGKVCILAATAAIGYLAAHGKEEYGGVPNPLRKLMKSIDKVREPWIVDAEKKAQEFHKTGSTVSKAASRRADAKAIFGSSFAGTVVLWWGGTAFAPIMKTLENNREKIANHFNKGKPEDIAIAHAHLKDEPKQNWGDVIRGRLVAFMYVWTACCTACLAAGRTKIPTNLGNYPLHFSRYEEKFGRWIAGFSKEGKEISKIPISTELTKVQKGNTSYNIGKILAIDLYATSLAIVLWNYSSRKSARKRRDAQNIFHETVETVAHPAARHFEDPAETPAPETTTNHASSFKKSESFVPALQERRDAEHGAPVGIGA